MQMKELYLDVVEHGNEVGKTGQLLASSGGGVDGGVDGVFDDPDADPAGSGHRFQVRRVVAGDVVMTQRLAPVDVDVVRP